jgi:hypothetical protein
VAYSTKARTKNDFSMQTMSSGLQEQMGKMNVEFYSRNYLFIFYYDCQ